MYKEWTVNGLNKKILTLDLELSKET